VIPREGVERRPKEMKAGTSRIFVIPREGVESHVVYSATIVWAAFPVIPREGVESSSPLREWERLLGPGDPERGS